MESLSNENLSGAVTVTVIEGQSSYDDLSQAAIYRQIKRVDVAINDLSSAGMMQKAGKAEIVMAETRELLSLMSQGMHLLKNDLSRVKTELAHIKKHGLGG